MAKVKDEPKSITIRIDEDDMKQWVIAQASPTASVRMAVRMAILQYGQSGDLLNAVLKEAVGRKTSETNAFSDTKDQEPEDAHSDTKDILKNAAGETADTKEPEAKEPEAAPEELHVTGTASTPSVKDMLGSLM